jgi:hypothetical protein
VSNDIVGDEAVTGQVRSRASWEAEYSTFDSIYDARMRGEGLPDFIDGNCWDEYVVRTQRFDDGQQEVVAFSKRVWRHFQAIRALPRGVRGKREVLDGETEAGRTLKEEKSLKTSVERSRRMIRKRCKAIRADRMLTLSTRANETRVEVWAKWWDEFRRRMNRVKDFHYVAVLERQERGAWHIHVAVHGRQRWKLLRSIWISVISKSGTDGAVNDSIGNGKRKWLFEYWGGKGRAMRHRIATYIAKYAGKDGDSSTFNKKRYWTSKGIVVPETTTYAQLGPELGAIDAVATAHQCVLHNGATCDGAQFYWNQGIGVFWMATGNTG